MGRDAQRWLEQVSPHFDFLRDHGFTRVDVDDSSFWSLWVQYRSADAAVRISKSNEFIRAEVNLIRLVDGEVPPYPIWITDERIDWVLLDSVVKLRRPDLVDETAKQHGLTRRELDGQLAVWAGIVRDVADDFLHGSFSAIDDVAVITRRLTAEHPQQVTVWLPESATPREEEQEREELRSTLPANVDVVVRRYRQGDASSDPGRRGMTRADEAVPALTTRSRRSVVAVLSTIALLLTPLALSASVEWGIVIGIPLEILCLGCSVAVLLITRAGERGRTWAWVLFAITLVAPAITTAYVITIRLQSAGWA